MIIFRIQSITVSFSNELISILKKARGQQYLIFGKPTDFIRIIIVIYLTEYTQRALYESSDPFISEAQVW
jgi:hypothetical protein